MAFSSGFVEQSVSVEFVTFGPREHLTKFPNHIVRHGSVQELKGFHRHTHLVVHETTSAHDVWPIEHDLVSNVHLWVPDKAAFNIIEARCNLQFCIVIWSACQCYFSVPSLSYTPRIPAEVCSLNNEKSAQSWLTNSMPSDALKKCATLHFRKARTV